MQYGSDMPLQDSSEAVMGSTDGLVTNQVFSVNITGLTPFTTYYYIVWANNSVGNTKTSVMSFITNETGNYMVDYDSTTWFLFTQLPVWPQMTSLLSPQHPLVSHFNGMNLLIKLMGSSGGTSSHVLLITV